MKSFFVILFLLVPYLVLSVEGVAGINMTSYDYEMMRCCAEENNSMDCCSKHGSNEPGCGSSSCGEIGCNIPLQLKNLNPTSLFSFDKVDVAGKLSFGLKDRNIISVHMGSIWNPPKLIS